MVSEPNGAGHLVSAQSQMTDRCGETPSSDVRSCDRNRLDNERNKTAPGFFTLSPRFPGVIRTLTPAI